MVGDFLHHRCHVSYHIVNLQHNWLSHRAELWKANDSYLLCFVGDVIGLGLAGWVAGRLAGWQGGWLGGWRDTFATSKSHLG